jgi:hypothetical protein
MLGKRGIRFIFPFEKIILACPWRKTTVRGSRRTPHGVGRQVMVENEPPSLKLRRFTPVFIMF